jgi:hypothetical protein
MSSNAGRSHDQALSSSPGDSTPLEEVSDVESFSRTRPEESDEEDELDIEAPRIDGASHNGVIKGDGGNDSPPLQLLSNAGDIGQAVQGSSGNGSYFPSQSDAVSPPQATLSAQVESLPSGFRLRQLTFDRICNLRRQAVALHLETRLCDRIAVAVSNRLTEDSPASCRHHLFHPAISPPHFARHTRGSHPWPVREL